MTAVCKAAPQQTPNKGKKEQNKTKRKKNKKKRQKDRPCLLLPEIIFSRSKRTHGTVNVFGNNCREPSGVIAQVLDTVEIEGSHVSMYSTYTRRRLASIN
jgi:hypothetical protein